MTNPPATPDPLQEVVRSLRTFPDQALVRLARAVSYELIRRDYPRPVALATVEAVYAHVPLDCNSSVV